MEQKNKWRCPEMLVLLLLQLNEEEEGEEEVRNEAVALFRRMVNASGKKTTIARSTRDC